MFKLLLLNVASKRHIFWFVLNNVLGPDAVAIAGAFITKKNGDKVGPKGKLCAHR